MKPDKSTYDRLRKQQRELFMSTPPEVQFNKRHPQHEEFNLRWRALAEAIDAHAHPAWDEHALFPSIESRNSEA